MASEKRIMRVFPRRTKATPTDDMVRIGSGPDMFDGCDEAHISVAFKWDLFEAERLEKMWQREAPTKIGGPATGEKSGPFVPGMYLQKGYVITSRGCPNKCWFCDVWKREGPTRELPIAGGYNVLDDNLLACSDAHIEAVFDMLSRQQRPPEFTGGLEAARLKKWHVKRLRDLKPKQVFFAYDTPDDFEPLREASRVLFEEGFTATNHVLRCYVLCGWPNDTMEAAEKRMMETMKLGFIPMAMVFRDQNGNKPKEWSRFQRIWSRPAIVYHKMKKLKEKEQEYG